MAFETGQNGPMQRTPAILIGIIVLAAVVIGAFLLLGRPAEPTSSGEPSASASAAASAASSASAEASLAADLLNRRWTVLYVGTDHNAAREADGQDVNTDALMLVSLSADQSRLTLVSLPRDTVDIPLADATTSPRKVNSLYREEGLETLVGAMETLYGVPIDAHIVVDMDDFSRLVDAVGGVDVNPQAPLVDPIVDLDLDAGPQELDARSAQAYVRTRVDQDYGRMARQQEVLLSLVERLVSPDTELDLRALISGLTSLETDVPIDELPTLIELARRAQDAEVERILIEPPLITFEGDRGDGRGYVLEPDVEAIRAAISAAIGE
jgi:LCP family protein required for cell wall assembly